MHLRPAVQHMGSAETFHHIPVSITVVHTACRLATLISCNG